LSISRVRQGLKQINCSTAYVIARIGQSSYRDHFVLKGAMLFQVWADAPHRPTRDLDLPGRGDPSPERCLAVFRELCEIRMPEDGIIFPAETASAAKIKEEQQYEGVRIKFLAHLQNVWIPIQVDVGFGDAVNPGLLDYPTLLPLPAPRVQAYPMDASSPGNWRRSSTLGCSTVE